MKKFNFNPWPVATILIVVFVGLSLIRGISDWAFVSSGPARISKASELIGAATLSEKRSGEIIALAEVLKSSSAPIQAASYLLVGFGILIFLSSISIGGLRVTQTLCRKIELEAEFVKPLVTITQPAISKHRDRLMRRASVADDDPDNVVDISTIPDRQTTEAGAFRSPTADASDPRIRKILDKFVE